MLTEPFAEVEIVSGVEGPCIVIGDRRVAGPKPWGGGRATHKWKVNSEDLINAIREASKQEELIDE